MAFQDIAGNGRIRRILRTALAHRRMPNSLLFCGPRGVGKRATARVLAQALNCRTAGDDACGVCDPCRLIGERKYPDVLEIEVAKDKTQISIEQMREMKGLAYLKPMLGARRVFIVDEAGTMDEPAANALLKILEEPPSFNHIILLSESRDLILPTLRSRCRVLEFQPVADEEIEQVLVARGEAPEQARLKALVVRGNMTRALDLDWEEVEAERREAWGLFRSLWDGSDVTALVRRFAAGGRRRDVQDSLERMIELFIAFNRDLLLLGEGGDPALLINPDYADELRAAAGGSRPGRSLRLAALLARMESGLERHAHLGLLATAFSARLLAEAGS